MPIKTGPLHCSSLRGVLSASKDGVVSAALPEDLLQFDWAWCLHQRMDCAMQLSLRIFGNQSFDCLDVVAWI